MGENKDKKTGSAKGKIRLDETLKLLFSVSEPLVINIVNYFFDESLDVNRKYDVEFMSTESTDLDMELRRADLLIKIGKTNSYHFEFQLNGNKYMVLRMFEYGYRSALRKMGEDDIPVIYFPKQAILYLEEGKGIQDELKLKVVFPITDKGEQQVIYKVIVKKAWEIDKKEKLERGLYSLLPLEIFKLRRKIERTKTASEDEFFRLSKQVKNDTINIIDISMKLMYEGKITEEDYTKITEATTYLLEYFSENYADLKLSKEVSEVSEYIYTKGKDEGMKTGKKEGIKEGIKEGRNKEKIELARNLLDVLDIKTISIKTGLSIEQVESIARGEL